MVKEIWKYPLLAATPIILAMPEGAVMLTVQTQRGTPCLWALVDPQAQKVDYTFHIIATGEPFNAVWDTEMSYVGSFQTKNETYVWHLFREQTGGNNG